ncbi:rod shape-determining protein RodA [candidate division KSB1 bacterium]|nr:rod shape-determining protein RodA [candidate division KSB1 bacterium]
MEFRRLKITSFDYLTLIVVLILVLIGMVAIYSSTYHIDEGSVLKSNFSKQLIWISISLIFMIAIIFIDPKYLRMFSYTIYGITIFLLLLTYLFPPSAGVQRWISIGSFQFQPSEFAKIGALLALAKYLSEERRNLNAFKDIVMAFLIVLIPFLLIVRQPDLGTSLVFVGFILPVLYWAGLPTFLLVAILAPFISLISAFNFYTFFVAMIIFMFIFYMFRRGLQFVIFNMLLNIGVGLITPIIWSKLHQYQRHRILTYLGIELDIQGTGYQVIQSKVAVGSGGLWGKGFLEGTQTQLRFLPAQHTDFIFSVIAEEFGFIGISFILLLFIFIILRGIFIASKARSKFSSLISIGATTIIGLHVMINVGMTVGIMPVTGIPLPLISYGGSSLMTSMLLIGLIINTSIRRYRY